MILTLKMKPTEFKMVKYRSDNIANIDHERHELMKTGMSMLSVSSFDRLSTNFKQSATNYNCR